jgi:UDP-N-acetylglucosamine 3-dehydrogenase
MVKPLRIVIIGAGNIARAHARAYAAQPPDQCQIVGCCDVLAAQADKLAGEFGGQAYTQTERMLAELRPDAVSVCTPPAYHLEQATLALEKGIPVLCEKPFSVDGPSARRLAGTARRLGVLLMPAHCHRFHGPVQQLKELIEAGKLGRLTLLQNRFAFKATTVLESWFVRKDVAGGGVLLDTAVHSVDLFRHLAGEVTWVSAQVSRTVTAEVEDSASLLLRSATGAIGQISCSWVSPPGEATVRLYGSAGSALLDYNEDNLLHYALDGTPGWAETQFKGPDRFANEVAHFMDCVRSGREPIVTPEDGARAIEIIDAAYRSAASGTAQTL